MTSTAAAPRVASQLGTWLGSTADLNSGSDAFSRALAQVDQPLFVVRHRDESAVTHAGEARLGRDADNTASALPLIAFVPALRPAQLGDANFIADHHLRFAFMTGAMANGIASTALVIAAGRAGLLGSYGAAGQSIPAIEQALDELESALRPDALPFCVNLIHSPGEPVHEARVVDLLIRRRVQLVEASAYLDLTLPAVKYRTHNIHRDGDGRIVTPNHIIAKVSRVEVATKWLSPPPRAMLEQLVNSGDLTREQADLAARIPMAQDLTAEADSGGHTDNRPAITLLPTMLALRDRLAAEHGYDMPLRVGAAGGIATPAGAAAAFAMGAAFIVTGSINQACVESGSSDIVRKMLADAQQADVTMAPAADMFEMGVKLQVLKRGTMFAMRAGKLYELYRAYPSLEAIPAPERLQLEKTVFRDSIDSIWQQTEAFFQQREPGQLDRASRDPKHRMALVFRWYLGKSSRWANAGDASRQIDYQVWCGPSMGAFNEWTRDTFLAAAEHRRVATVSLNLLHGAAVTTRISQLRAQGVTLPPEATRVPPRTIEQLERIGL